MIIGVDTDACPVVIKGILVRAAERTGIQLTQIANQALRTPNSDFIDPLQVPRGFDVVDDEIVNRLTAGDLVITSNIPLVLDRKSQVRQVVNRLRVDVVERPVGLVAVFIVEPADWPGGPAPANR